MFSILTLAMIHIFSVPAESGEGPSVEAALSMSPTQAQAQAEPRKSLIGAKKQPARKGVSLHRYNIYTLTVLKMIEYWTQLIRACRIPSRWAAWV